MVVRLVALLALLSRVSAQDVLVGTASTFDSQLKEFGRVLVKFVAPWCEQCKSLEAEFDKAAQQLHDDGFRTKLMSVDVVEEESLAARFNVERYPKFAYFSAGRESDYDGDWTAGAIITALRRRELPPFKRIDAADEDHFLAKGSEGEFSVVARLKKGSVREKAFKEAIERLADFDWSTFHYAVSSLPKGSDAKRDASLRMHRPGFDKMNETENLAFEAGAWTWNGIKQWLLDSSYPLVDRMFVRKKYSPDVLDKLGYDGAVVAVVEDNEDGDENAPNPQEIRSRAMLAGIAPRFPRWKFVVTAFSAVESPYQETVLADSDGSISVLLPGNKRYQLLKDLEDPAVVSRWLDDVKSSKAKRFYTSASPPGEPVDADGVLTLTGQTWDEYVMDPTKDVFVEYYAPWCGHCNELQPVWSKLARDSVSQEWDKKGVIIAKMDATENQCEEEVGQFPKLVLYPAVASKRKVKAKLEFTGLRTLDGLTDFLLNGAVNLEGVEVLTKHRTRYAESLRPKRDHVEGSKTEL